MYVGNIVNELSEQVMWKFPIRGRGTGWGVHSST